MKKFILASASPRRIEMFKDNGIDVDIMPADIEETLPDNIKATDAVMLLALKKALHIEEKILAENPEENAERIIVAADTVVFSDRILGKPEDEEDAFRMLSSLRNDSHYVATGVAIIKAGTTSRRAFYDATEVVFKDYSDEDIWAYIRTGEPMDKAGAYAIQGGFGKYVKEYRGSYRNIVGFPWEKFCEEVEQM